MDKNLQAHIEALIFATDEPITFKEIRACLSEVMEAKIAKEEVETSLEKIQQKYAAEDFAFELVNIAGGYQLLTKGAYHHTVGVHLKLTTRKRLSRTALETLSIIAYKQPVPKSELEKIRGVSCDYSIQKLLEKELVEIIGREEAPGRPLLYGTSEKFMNYFGLSSLKDLPTLKDFQQADSEIGEAAPIEEEAPEAPAGEEE